MLPQVRILYSPYMWMQASWQVTAFGAQVTQVRVLPSAPCRVSLVVKLLGALNNRLLVAGSIPALCFCIFLSTFYLLISYRGVCKLLYSWGIRIEVIISGFQPDDKGSIPLYPFYLSIIRFDLVLITSSKGNQMSLAVEALLIRNSGKEWSDTELSHKKIPFLVCYHHMGEYARG